MPPGTHIAGPTLTTRIVFAINLCRSRATWPTGQDGLLTRHLMDLETRYRASGLDENTLVHFHLGGNPRVCLFQSLAQWSRRTPTQLVKDQSVVGIAASNSERTFNMANTQLLPRNLHD